MSWLSNFGDKLYDQSTGGWLGQKMNDIVGDDYQKHLINMSVGQMTPLNAAGGYLSDYQQAEGEGENGWDRVGGNAARSAAILAAIFGGAAAAGEGAAGGAEGGGAGGTPAAGTGTAGTEGGGTGGFNWQQFAQKGMGNMGQSYDQTAEQQRVQQFDSQGRAMEELAQALARKRAQEGQGVPIY